MFFSISKGLQDSIVNVTKGLKVEEHQDDHPLVEINNIAAVIDGVRSDRKYNDADHAHNSLSKMVSYQKAKIAELYVNGEKTKHYELNKRYDDFEPKKLSEESFDEARKLEGSYSNTMVKEDNQLPEAMDNDDVKKAMSDFIAKGGKVQTLKPKKEPREKFYTSSTAHQRGRGSRSSSVMRAEENMDEQMKLHPMGLHVMPVKVQGKTMHKVHAVGSGLASGIKVGEHLTDTHLDDAVEMGAKIKRLKEQAVDSTIELHDDFTVDLPYELSYRDYLDAAQSYSEDPSEAILIADSFFKKRDESLVIENFMRSDIDSKIKSHEKAGSKVDDTKYSTKNGKPYAEYTVTDSEGRKTRYIHHGSTRRVERQ